MSTLSRHLGHLLDEAGVSAELSTVKEDLVLLLDGMWHRLPWEAAKMGEEFLGTRLGIVRNDSVAVWRLLESESRDVAENGGSAALFCPEPSNLPGSSAEMEAVARTLEKFGWRVRKFVGPEATPSQFLSTLRKSQVRIIHFMGHSFYHPSDPLLSAIHLNPEPHSSRASGELTAFEIQTLGLCESSPLVYLSSCESGAMRVSGGNEAFGVPRAFLIAGVRSLVVANSIVRDSTARKISTDFYEALLGGDGPATALRKARARAAKRSGLGFTHWAPFYAFGALSSW
jgi:CHAT domain-containing protein